jgi:hypothetical protein
MITSAEKAEMILFAYIVIMLARLSTMVTLNRLNLVHRSLVATLRETGSTRLFG